MKKVLIAVLALAAVACNKAEVIDQTPANAITFESVFVDNATKAAYDGSYNTGNLSMFEVYATITGEEGNTANIFQQEKVEKGNSLGQGVNWSYNSGNTQYWVPGNDYSFRAIADGNVDDVTTVETNVYGMATTINLLDASAQKDILTAEHNVNQYNNGYETTVKFTFAHILSKVKFTVKNTVETNNGYSYKVSDIKIHDVAKNGVYTFNSGWSAAATPVTYDLSFGNAVDVGTVSGAEATNIPHNSSMESNYDRLLIPTTSAFHITFDYQLLKDGIVIDTKDDEDITTGNLELKPGHAYNFIFSLGNPGDPIQFDLETVTGWNTSHTGYNQELSM